MNRKRILLSLVFLMAGMLACNLPGRLPGRQSDTGTGPNPQTVVPSPTATQAQDPCINVLYPLAPGNRWVYRSTSSGASQPTRMAITVTSVENSLAQLEARDLASGTITSAALQCEAGTIKNIPASVLDLLIGKYFTGAFGVEYVSGMFAPAEEQFISANWDLAWDGVYIANGSLTIPGAGQDIQIALQQAQIDLTWQTAGAGEAAFESVTVPAGTCDRALKVNMTMTFPASLVIEGVPIDGSVIIHATQWFVPDNGLAKIQIDSAEATYFGITLPIPMQAVVELEEFHPAPAR